MLDWLLAAQKRVENKLAKRHLKQGGVLLFDLSSSYFEGHKCSIGKYGKNRDGKRGKEQINYALVCAPDGCPVSVQVFPGNTGDPRALTALARSMRNRFGIDSVAVVGDRGMITSKRIRDDLTPLGLDWITALKKNQIRTLLKVPEKEAEPGEKVEKKPPLCPETLVPDEVNEITAPSYPRERLMACLNPRLQNEQRRKREELLLATEKELQEIHRLVENGTLDTKEKIDRRLRSEVNKMKVAKHLTITTTEKSLSWKRNTDKIREEARLDGIYVIRTSLKTDAISGKTTLCRRLCDSLNGGLYRVAYTSMSTGSVIDTYAAIAEAFGRPAPQRRLAQWRAVRTEITRLNASQTPFLIFDEAHHLSNQALEELRLLTNYAMDSEKRLCMLLVGLPPLRKRLRMGQV